MTMLRLASSRIHLTASDLDWHVRRHERRLAKLLKGEKPVPFTDDPNAQVQSPGPKRRVIPDELPRRPPKGEKPAEEIPIYSDEPVPRDSQEFWDRILADAGTSARVHQMSLARSPQVIFPSSTFLENNGSVRLSIRDEEEEDENVAPDGVSMGEILISPRSPVSDWESAASTQILSRLSPLSPPSLDVDEGNRQILSPRTSLERLSPSSQAIHDVNFEGPQHINNRKAGAEQAADPQDSWPNQMDVDGPSDAGPSLHHYSSTSSLQDPEPGTFGMPFGAKARKAELAAFRNVSIAGSEANDLPFQDSYTSHHQGQHVRTRSGVFPRSRLYISEAAASSSPDKHEKQPPQLDDPASAEEHGLLLLPPRRRKKYKRRSETYSFVASEASTSYRHPSRAASASNNFTYANSNDGIRAETDDSASPFFIHDEQPTTYQHGSAFVNHEDQLSSPRPNRFLYPTSSPYRRSTEHHSPRSSSTYPHGMSHPSREVSWTDLPHDAIINTRGYATFPRQPSQRLPLPFGNVSRNTSNSYSLASNIPSDENSPNPNNAYNASTPPSPLSVSTTGIQPTPSRLSVYNDSLPAYYQPQTPIGLPRNGLPRMSLQNPFFTAPARARTRIGRDFADRLQEAFATPSRGLRRTDGRMGMGIGTGPWRYEQENVSLEIEAERLEWRMEEQQQQRGEDGWETDE
ncbi:MAG: hypothetical protein Q9181_003997 [Wetmoreana brouardii]